MDEERAVEKIVTKFLINTCRLRPQLSRPALEAAAHRVIKAAIRPVDDREVHYIPLTTGSVAEFYIEPMLPQFGDIDVMYHCSDLLAIPRGQSPPTQLPAEFSDYVEVYEIIDSHFPGYVYLKLRYLLTECVDEDKYIAVETDRQTYFRYRCRVISDVNSDVHGPAVSIVHHDTLFSTDNVHCVRCLSWPPEAAYWPTRHRIYGWPDSATVNHVVNNGCDVVRVAHRQCRQHEWMRKNQFRLSFSRAEIVLLNSWMPVQQIVYHMLRVFMKTERLTDSADNSETGKLLSNYHIKTLLLWAFEQVPKSWWTDDLSLISICVELLHNLRVWLIEARCPHYFINKCNLVDNSFNLEIIVSRLMPISKLWLSSWFVNNYIRKCFQLCPRNVSRLFDDVSTNAKLQNAISAIVDWKFYTVHVTENVLAYAEWLILSTMSRHSLSMWSLNWWLMELPTVSTRFSVYFIAVALLHVACVIRRSGFNDEFMDVLATVFGQFAGPRRYSNQRGSSLSLIKAIKLMKAVTNNNSRSTVQLIEIELSKAYLYRALRCKDSDSDSMYCLANVYLAVLYYTTGQYQTAIDHCTLVTRSQDHSQCNSHVVQGELLPKIDDDIDVVLGLAVFYQHVRTSALSQQQQSRHVTVFTTELFAHYLLIKCLSVIKCQQLSDTAESKSSTAQVQSYVKYISEKQQLFIADALLRKSINCLTKQRFFCNLKFRRCPSELNTSQLVELLQQSAVEHLTTFRQLEAQNLGSVVTIVTTDFEAMYAYKRGDYQRCLQLSTQNVRTLLYAGDMHDVPTFPMFIQLLDDDIVCLTALTLIIDPNCRDIGKIPGAYITQLTLSLYLITQCQLKLRHSVTSLAQTIDYMKVAQTVYPVVRTLDHLTLKLSARCMLRYLRDK